MASRCHSRRLVALEFIQAYFARFGASPSHKELAAELRLPIQRVGRILDELEADGEIMRTPKMPRGIRLQRPLQMVASSEMFAELRMRGDLTVDDVVAVLRTRKFTVFAGDVGNQKV